jgi:antitoxin FitA
MVTITLTLPDEQWLHLKKRADQLGVTPEELLQTNISEMLTKSDEEFEQAMKYVLTKNTELYRRLA